MESAVTDLLTDEQKRAIAAGGDVLDILDASSEDVQYQLGALGDTFLKNLSPEQKHAVLFLGSDLFSDIPLGTRERIWSVLHSSAGKITAQELIQLGVFGKEDLDRAENAALLTEAEYRNTAFGETIQYFQAKNDAERFAQLTGLLSTPYVDLVEELFHGKNTKTFGNSKFDQLESTGYAGPSHVPGSQTAVESASPTTETKQKPSNDSSNANETDTNSWYNADGSIHYPPNGGAVPGSEQVVTLKPGKRLSRFGKVKRKSNFVTDQDASPADLALPPTTDSSYYYEYEIVKPIPNVRQSTVAE